MTTTSKQVIIIDDDPCNNLIFKTTLKNLCKPIVPAVKAFTSPEEGLYYMENDFVAAKQPVVLFLDINMPVLNGWEVLERLSKLPGISKQLLTLFVFSSSMDISDKEKAMANPLVKRYIEKPLSVAMNWLKQEVLGEVVACS